MPLFSNHGWTWKTWRACASPCPSLLHACIYHGCYDFVPRLVDDTMQIGLHIFSQCRGLVIMPFQLILRKVAGGFTFEQSALPVYPIAPFTPSGNLYRPIQRRYYRSDDLKVRYIEARYDSSLLISKANIKGDSSVASSFCSPWLTGYTTDYF